MKIDEAEIRQAVVVSKMARKDATGQMVESLEGLK